MLALTGAVIVIAVVIALGDNVGVQIARFGPDGTASRTSVISVQFTEPMNRASVEERLEVSPAVAGEVSWSGSRLLFRPEDGFEEGREYFVSIAAGAESEAGRDLLDALEFSFRVRGSRIAYLNASDSEIWIADPSNTGELERLSFTANGVAFFDVAPGGSEILFREKGGIAQGEPKPQLVRLDLLSGWIDQLTFLDTVSISDAAWNHDGSLIAFSSSDEGPLVPGDEESPITVSPPRVSVLDLAISPPVISRLLRLGTESSDDPHWSPSENLIAVGVTPLTPGGIASLTVVDLESGPVYSIDTDMPESITFSEDGSEFMVLVRTGVNLKSPTEIWKVEATTGRLEQVILADDFESVRDSRIAWRPGHTTLAVIREATNGADLPKKELHLIDYLTGTSTPLLVDPDADVRAIEWSPNGGLLAVDLVRTGEGESSQQIAVLDVDEGEIVAVINDASDAAWIP